MRKHGKIAGRLLSSTIAAALLFSGMNIETFAKEGTGLPSAGIDFFMSSNATSVKDLKDESDSVSTSTSQGTDASQAASASPAVPGEEPLQEKVIEETMMATTTKTVQEKEKEIETKKEEERFKSLVIADVNDYVNVRSIPSEEGEILGKLYDDSVGEFISEQDG